MLRIRYIISKTAKLCLYNQINTYVHRILLIWRCAQVEVVETSGSSSLNHAAQPKNDLTGLIWRSFQPGARSHVEIDFSLYLEGYSRNTSLGLNPAFRIRYISSRKGFVCIVITGFFSYVWNAMFAPSSAIRSLNQRCPRQCPCLISAVLDSAHAWQFLVLVQGG